MIAPLNLMPPLPGLVAIRSALLSRILSGALLKFAVGNLEGIG
jgi:hypothetical protein